MTGPSMVNSSVSTLANGIGELADVAPTRPGGEGIGAEDLEFRLAVPLVDQVDRLAGDVGPAGLAGGGVLVEVDRAPEADLLDLALAAADGPPRPALAGRPGGVARAHEDPGPDPVRLHDDVGIGGLGLRGGLGIRLVAGGPGPRVRVRVPAPRGDRSAPEAVRGGGGPAAGGGYTNSVAS